MFCFYVIGHLACIVYIVNTVQYSTACAVFKCFCDAMPVDPRFIIKLANNFHKSQKKAKHKQLAIIHKHISTRALLARKKIIITCLGLQDD